MKRIEFHPPTSSQAGEIIAANILLRSTTVVGLDIASRNRRFGDFFVDIDAVGADDTVLRRAGCVLPCCRADTRETNRQLHFRSFKLYSEVVCSSTKLIFLRPAFETRKRHTSAPSRLPSSSIIVA